MTHKRSRIYKMRSLAKLMRCFIALFVVIQILRTAESAPLDSQLAAQSQQISEKNDLVIGRQASEDDSYEDSDEDDGEDDAEQAQQSLIEQQNQQNQEESQEGSDEEDGGDEAVDDVRRHRRDVAEMPTDVPSNEVAPAEKEPNTSSSSSSVDTPAESSPAVTVTEESNTIPSLNRTSVLILIRDALKKVTTVLPAGSESVATSALQYFQLFEHFIQQTIEQVIEDYDEDEEEATTAINLSNGSEGIEENTENINVDQSKEPVAEIGTDHNKVEQASVPQAQPANTLVEPVKEAESNAEKTTTTT